jgi:hypothetical protein
MAADTLSHEVSATFASGAEPLARFRDCDGRRCRVLIFSVYVALLSSLEMLLKSIPHRDRYLQPGRVAGQFTRWRQQGGNMGALRECRNRPPGARQLQHFARRAILWFSPDGRNTHPASVRGGLQKKA